METETQTVKKTQGRRKIPMKKIEKKSQRQVTFTKRRQGLFRKASELSLLCGAEVGIIVLSPGNKVFTFETSSLESLINRVDGQNWNIVNPKDGGGGKYEQPEGGFFWWDEPFEDLELPQLQEFLAGLEFLREVVPKKIKSR